MSDHFGENLRIQIFGESHGPGVGCVIDGLEPGLMPDWDQVRFQMSRRAPGGAFSTPRSEADEVEILSGVKDGVLTGTSIAAFIRNTNTRSGDYEKTMDLLRPSHADHTGHIKYKGFEDRRGGGHFSARVTAGLVFAGALAEQMLKKFLPYQAGSHITRIGSEAEKRFQAEDLNAERLEKLTHERLPVLDPAFAERYASEIRAAAAEEDSVGGRIETALVGLPAGLGDPFFDSMESRLAHLLFSVPAMKGLSFGLGFDLAGMRGSEANDSYRIEQGEIRTRTNHNGGILGGITNGMPVVFETVFKPTASIGRAQQTVNIAAMREEELVITGRHDPCIVPRAIPVVEACAAIACLDAFLGFRKYQ